ncbi:hypothetical protein [Rhizobium sp. C1]|uniref:hypothetical protein n=1 Tax=Rhizobium sp. C1 TaxID=1349799 RepID=UPI001E3913F9|nr:hypothetical protein [Rhizobium sp. C1]MCD2176684.1 hypothetical protein [Rhizobium sp. C1]
MTSSMPDQVEIQSTDITVDPAAYTSEGPGAGVEMGSEVAASRSNGQNFWKLVSFHPERPRMRASIGLCVLTIP